MHFIGDWPGLIEFVSVKKILSFYIAEDEKIEVVLCVYVF